MNNYDISIVIPCYNVSQYLDRCIKSIENQTKKNYEIIFINDGSTDNTLEILNNYPFKSSKENIHILTFPNQGVSQSRNEGIKIATGKYIYFLDPDDWIAPNTLLDNYNLCEQYNCDAIQFGYEATDLQGNSTWCNNGNKKEGVYNQIDIQNILLPRFIGYSICDIANYGTPTFYKNTEMCSVWRFLYKRELIKKYNILFSKEIKLGEDSFFNCHYFLYSQKIFINNNKYYHYTIKPSGLMSTSLADGQSLLNHKLNGLYERRKIREICIKKINIDIFPLYAGSLFLSAMELAVKNSQMLKNKYLFIKYIAQTDVQKAISLIPLKGNVKIKAILFIIKHKHYTLIFNILHILHKLKIKIY